MTVSYQELVAQARARITEVEPADLESRLGSDLVVVDVREDNEYAAGAIPGAVHLARGVLEGNIARVAAPEDPIVLYCAGAARSALAAVSLLDMGYCDVTSLAGGMERWKREGRPLDTPTGLTPQQHQRYARHLTLPEIGVSGQQSLLDAKVLLVGAGGLGSPVALYLAAAGVGTIGVVDDDVVEASNLQRQVLHSTERLGVDKAESARETIRALNPDVKVEVFAGRLDAANALALMAGHDVVVDGADNFPTRYLVNDAALHLRVPVVHGSIFRFEGQVAVFDPYAGPCYRCLHPLPPPPELAPNCAEAGVLGVLPGVIGSMQAVEAIKLLVGIGEPLRGRILAYDALSQETVTLRVDRDPACPACRDEDAPPPLVDYDLSCRPAGA